jgi:hypothetical protein
MVHLIYYDVVTEDDVLGGLNMAYDLLVQSTMPMHIIFNFNDATRLPEHLLNLIGSHDLVRHDMLGYCVFLKPSSFIHIIGHVLDMSMKVHVLFVEGEDDAWEFFNQMGLC